MANDFYLLVYEVVKKIPYGKVTSYGAIAQFLGATRSARIVGYAMNASKKDMSIPAHRVVNRKGMLTGKLHFSGINLMQQLLENEGIKVKNNQIVNFEHHFWDPCKHLTDIPQLKDDHTGNALL